MKGIRLGELLVDANVMSAEQVEHVLAVQRSVGRPFGDLAERLYGVHPKLIERAWAEQYARITGTVSADAVKVEGEAIRTLTRRQAWQFHVLPFQRSDEELFLVTDQKHLARAVNFATAVINEPVFFVITDSASLQKLLMQHYPISNHLAEMASTLG
ncbi:MAG TPA: hypothetical protein PK402_03980 [Tepidisphaeraceae bacterium]|nr:hypothetical protein [Tepidisphaeraceae bacterium]